MTVLIRYFSCLNMDSTKDIAPEVAASQLTGFYVRATLALNGLTNLSNISLH